MKIDPLPTTAPNIRVVSVSTELPEEPRSFDFSGDADALAAFITQDGAQWHCVEYIAFLNPDSQSLWSVWRR